MESGFLTIFSSISGMMEYLALKDQSDGTRTHRGTWEEDQSARLDLESRAKAMLLDFEKRRAKLNRSVSSFFALKPWLLEHPSCRKLTFIVLEWLKPKKSF